ncbi:MAG: alpha/beta hydrolase [Bacteroidota bacterium]
MKANPLFFIHDFTLDHRMWDDQFYYFSKWYRCIRYDIRGYGQSALPGPEYYTYHDDLKRFIDFIGDK